MTTETAAKIVDAYAEWDDRRGAFRVYVSREEPDDGEVFPGPSPLPAFARCVRDSVEWRLHLAAWIKATKAMAKADSGGGEPLGWSGEVKGAQKAAQQVANAMRAELNCIADGKPAPSPEAVQIAMIAAGVRK